jgi:hypothetical protein
LPDVPLMMWAEDGSMIQFCEDCAEQWIEAAP